MPSVELDGATHIAIELASRLSGLTPGEVVARLVNQASQPSPLVNTDQPPSLAPTTHPASAEPPRAVAPPRAAATPILSAAHETRASAVLQSGRVPLKRTIPAAEATPSASASQKSVTGRPLDPSSLKPSGVRIYVDYEDVRTDARLTTATGRIIISSGPLAGEGFDSPSGAARAVVAHYKPGVNPNRNGWGFWLVAATDAPLQTIRYR